ncbi:MAG: ABC transporter permease [Chloroflexota bacterium]
MTRFLWRQLVGAKSRTLALASGILAAAVSFVLLTSAATTGTIQTKGIVEANFRSAYDILVRPPGSSTDLEEMQGLVRPNYLSGLRGGISLEEWQVILEVLGVDVAAPVANVGFVMPFAAVRIPADLLLASQPSGLYRIRFTWEANGGLSQYPGRQDYIYITPPQSSCAPDDGYYLGRPEEASPFQLPVGLLECIEKPAGRWVTTAVYFPLLLAAIDPVQEDRLLNLRGALVGSGRGLREGESYTHGPFGPTIPVIVSTRTFADVSLHVKAEAIELPADVDLPAMAGLPDAGADFGRLPGDVIATETLSNDELYDKLFEEPVVGGPPVSIDWAALTYWTASSAGYRTLAADELEALPVQQDLKAAWGSRTYEGGWYPAPPGNQDVQYRQLAIHDGVVGELGDGTLGWPYASFDIVGRFDPARLPGFSPLSKVPLESYEPPLVEPADAASIEALAGGNLLPTMNLGGYVQQPPFLFTTLEAAMGMLDPKYFEGGDPEAPISAIRVRVAGVTGPDPLSLARINAVALAIHEQTGLAVDVTAGSSPAPILVHLAPGEYGQPALLVREGWTRKGIAITILQAVDRKSLALFALVLFVTGLFVTNGALASVRSRRTELGTLLALGWSRSRIFAAVLGEVALVGLLAGLAGTGLAVALVDILGLEMPLTQVLLVAPVAAILATLAGVPSAWRASRLLPIDAVRPAVAERNLGRRVRGLASMGLMNLWRLPGRTLVASIGLFIGVAALALLLAITLAFKGTLVGSALGAVISVQIRGVDYLAVAMAVGLAAVSVADVLFLNLRERAAELVALRASGWQEGHLVRMIAVEGLGIALLGSVPGAMVGVGLAAGVGGPPGEIVLAGLIAAAGGTGVTLLAALVPASLISRMTPPAVLAEE